MKLEDSVIQRPLQSTPPFLFSFSHWAAETSAEMTTGSSLADSPREPEMEVAEPNLSSSLILLSGRAEKAVRVRHIHKKRRKDYGHRS